MSDEEKRSINRKRVKRHRTVKKNVDKILLRRSRDYLRRYEARSSGQSGVGVCDADIDYPRRDLCTGIVSSNINIEQVTSDSEMRSSVSGEPNVKFVNEDEQVEIDEPTSPTPDYDIAKNTIESVSDEGQVAATSGARPEEIYEITQIHDWAIRNDIQRNNLDELLVILGRRLIPSLPKSSQTFLNTAAVHYTIREMESSDGSKGEYVYFGIANNICACVHEALHEDGTLHLQFNVNGVPLFNSSSKQFWPIFGKVHLDNPDIYKPFAVAIYCGDGKPKDVNDFLKDFVCELNQLLAEGIMINGNNLSVKIHCFICDTAARSFLKCISGHDGYSACERCETRGERNENRTVYPNVHCQERTNRSFRLQTQREHHYGHSPLLEIQPSLDLVSRFALDFMHVCCIGIMKKLAEYWIFGETENRLQRKNKLGSQQRQELSNRMNNLRRCIPMEFQRTLGSVNRIAMWKATEFRFFLLYCGPIVLRGILHPNLYKHFLLLHTACRVLCSKDLAFKYNNHAKIFLKTFFTSMPVFYERQSQILNAHNLIHIADDVTNMGCTLNKISAFPFESLLERIKMHLRDANRPLAQMCRRLQESSLTEKKSLIPQAIEILKLSKRKEAERIKVEKIKYKGFILTTKFPNNLVILHNDVIITVSKMLCIEGIPESTEIEGKEWKIKSSIFKYPTPSRTLKMWRLANQPTMRTIRCNVHEVYCKMMQLEIDGRTSSAEKKYYAIPFLHE